MNSIRNDHYPGNGNSHATSRSDDFDFDAMDGGRLSADMLNPFRCTD